MPTQALLRLVVLQRGHQFQADAAVGQGERLDRKDPLHLVIGLAAQLARLAHQQGQFGVDARGDDLALQAGAKLQMPPQHARLVLQIVGLVVHRVRAGRLIAQLHDLRQLGGYLPAQQPRAEAVPRQAFAQLRCEALLVDGLPQLVVDGRIAEGEADEKHFQHDAVGRHLGRHSGDFAFGRAGVVQPAMASTASSRMSPTRRHETCDRQEKSRRKVGRTRFGSPRVAAAPGHVKGDWPPA